MNKLQAIAHQIAGHIEKPMTADEIADALESGDYSAEIIMQHLLLLACPRWRYFRGDQIWKMPPSGEGFCRLPDESSWSESICNISDFCPEEEITAEEGEP